MEDLNVPAPLAAEDVNKEEGLSGGVIMKNDEGEKERVEKIKHILQNSIKKGERLLKMNDGGKEKIGEVVEVFDDKITLETGANIRYDATEGEVRKSINVEIPLNNIERVYMEAL